MIFSVTSAVLETWNRGRGPSSARNYQLLVLTDVMTSRLFVSGFKIGEQTAGLPGFSGIFFAPVRRTSAAAMPWPPGTWRVACARRAAVAGLMDGRTGPWRVRGGVNDARRGCRAQDAGTGRADGVAAQHECGGGGD
jgi:hypothetical protein